MGIAVSGAGVSLGWAVEATAGSAPTTFTSLPDIKSIPELNPEPSSLDTTDLSQTEYKTSIAGLKELGVLSFGANLTNELITGWEALMTAHDTAKGSGKKTYFCITIPTLKKKVIFSGEPSALGLPAIEVDSVIEVNCYVTVTGAPKMSAVA